MSNENSADRIRRGRIRRTAPLAALSARTAGEAVVVGLRNKFTGADSGEFHARTAERYAELLGNSKGALMKAGQMLSFVSLGPAIPSEFQRSYQAALARLRDAAPPMAPELARTVLESELGRSVASVFAEFDFQPLAAASIGQVHAARLHDGREVAVKVQYPGVADAIDADLKNTDLLFTFLALIVGISPRGLKIDLRAAAAELRARIVEELDYRLEASNQSDFARVYRGHPFIHVPDVIPELSTGRVLTQELVCGKSWAQALEAERQLRDRWGEAIYRFHYESFERGFCNSDTHPGNFIFHDDGTVSCLDFGAVKRFQGEQVEALLVLVAATIRGDVEATWRSSVEGGFLDSTAPITKEELFEYWRVPYEMYWQEQPFTVDAQYMNRHIEYRYNPNGPAAKAFRNFAMPAEFTIMFRADIGAQSLLAGLRATNDWRSIAEEYFEGKEPQTELGRLNRAFFDQPQPAASHA